MGFKIHLVKDILNHAKSVKQQRYSNSGANSSRRPTTFHSSHAHPTLGSVPLLCSTVLWMPHFPYRTSKIGWIGNLPILANNLHYLIPHMPISPQEVCPFFAQHSFDCPTSLPGFNNRPNMKSQSLVAAVWRIGKKFPVVLSPGENA
jgi:hypothetical protein